MKVKTNLRCFIILFLCLFSQINAQEQEISLNDKSLLNEFLQTKNQKEFNLVYDKNIDRIKFNWIMNVIRYGDWIARFSNIDQGIHILETINKIISPKKKSFITYQDILTQIKINETGSEKQSAIAKIVSDTTLASAYIDLKGDLLKAKSLLLEALNLCNKEKLSGEIKGEVLFRLANISMSQSDFKMATKFNNEAYSLFKGKSEDGEANSLLLKSQLAMRMPDSDSAKRYLEQACPKYKKNNIGEANCYYLLGDVWFNKQDFKNAKKYYIKAIDSSQKRKKYILGIANSKARLADMYSLQKNFNEAIELYQDAKNLYNKVGNIHGDAACLGGLGSISFQLGQFPSLVQRFHLREAEKSFKESISLYEKIFNKYEQIGVLNMLAYIYLMRRENEEARNTLRKCVNVALEVKSDMSGLDNKILFSERISLPMKGSFLEFLREKENEEFIFQLKEEFLTRSFFENMSQHFALEASGLSKNYIDRWVELSQKRAMTNQTLSNLNSKNANEKVIENAKQDYEAANRKLEEYEEELTIQKNEDSPETKDSKRRFKELRHPEVPDVKLSSQSLSENEVAISFIDAKLQVGAFISYKDQPTESQNLNINGDSLSKLVTDYRTLLNDDNYFQKKAQTEEKAKEIYRILLEPILKNIPENYKQIVIIPDGAIGILPIDSVLEHAGITGYTISYAPSLSILYKLRSKERDYSNLNRKPIVAFGGAYYSGRGIGSLLEETKQWNDPRQRELALLEIKRDGFKEGNWNDLPGGRLETVNTIEMFYDNETDRKAATFLGAWASEEALKSLNKGSFSKEGKTIKLDQIQYLHLSLHGKAEQNFPETSRVILSQKSQMPKEELKSLKTNFPNFPNEDGSLLASEIVGLNVKTDLIVLSACETGIGKLSGTEGIIGLTRSWMIAGTNGVLVSLWSISDFGTSVFMHYFYSSLKEFNDPKKALYFAQGKLKSGEWKNDFLSKDKPMGNRDQYKELKLHEPKYWAAFQYWGK
ncbi:MAG: CHAT domain-containing protein [Leptospiraceae bacterium]|nr:CHAT domain-containing protein [Leptospiraceae bacterium]